MRHELRPALVHVGGAAPVVRRQTEDVGVRAVARVDAILRYATDHLVRLLVVLVRPHVGLEGRGQRVEGDPLQAVSQCRLAQDGDQDLQRVHQLDHRAELRSLRRVPPREVLITREHARSLPVVGIQRREYLEHGTPITCVHRLPIPDAWLFHPHRVVHDVRPQITLLRRHLSRELQRSEMGPPIVSLLPCPRAELQ